MPKRIVYTRPDGGVSICAPSLTAIAYMTGGGGRWDGFPRGFLDRQVAEQAKYGVGEWAAARFVRAMQFGALTTAEAYGIIRDRFCAHLGTGCELWNVEDVPTDRTYRDAWRRSANGGPILLDERKVRLIQEGRMWAAYEARRHGGGEASAGALRVLSASGQHREKHIGAEQEPQQQDGGDSEQHDDKERQWPHCHACRPPRRSFRTPARGGSGSRSASAAA